MAKINTTTWQYTYTDPKSWKEVTKTIKNWSSTSDSMVSQLTNAANNSGGKVTITNDTSNAWYWKERWTGNLMYNNNYAISDMYGDNYGNTIITRSDWSKTYRDKAWNDISEATYNSMIANTKALWLDSSVKGLSNTYNYSNSFGDTGWASSKSQYQWFGTAASYNPTITLWTLWGW